MMGCRAALNGALHGLFVLIFIKLIFATGIHAGLWNKLLIYYWLEPGRKSKFSVTMGCILQLMLLL